MGFDGLEWARAEISCQADAVEDVAQGLALRRFGATAKGQHIPALAAKILRQMPTDEALRAEDRGLHLRQPMVLAGAPALIE